MPPERSRAAATLRDPALIQTLGGDLMQLFKGLPATVSSKETDNAWSWDARGVDCRGHPSPAMPIGHWEGAFRRRASQMTSLAGRLAEPMNQRSPHPSRISGIGRSWSYWTGFWLHLGGGWFSPRAIAEDLELEWALLDYRAEEIKLW